MIARVAAVTRESSLALSVLSAPVVMIQGTRVSLPVSGWGDSWWLSGQPHDEPEHRPSFICFSSESCSYLRSNVNSSWEPPGFVSFLTPTSQLLIQRNMFFLLMVHVRWRWTRYSVPHIYLHSCSRTQGDRHAPISYWYNSSILKSVLLKCWRMGVVFTLSSELKDFSSHSLSARISYKCIFNFKEKT